MKEKRTEQGWAAKRAYDKEMFLRKTFVFHKENEADIMEWLLQQENMSAYVKDLIRKDMKGNK